MKVSASTTLAVGDGPAITFHVNDENDRMAIVWAYQLATPRDTCNVCGHIGLEEKRLEAYRTKDGFPYVKIICPCGAESALGAHKTEGFFWPRYEEPPQGVGRNREPEPEPEPGLEPPRSCTKDQAAAIARTAKGIGFSGGEELLTYVSDTVGRPIQRLGELSWQEAETILKGLREF